MTAVTAPVAQAHADATGTEKAAQRRAARFAGGIRGRLLAALADAGDCGLTVLEALEVLDLPERRRYSLAPRLPELVDQGYAEKTDRARERCAVYVATDAGRTWAQRGAV